jgi:hypothetical protein
VNLSRHRPVDEISKDMLLDPLVEQIRRPDNDRHHPVG